MRQFLSLILVVVAAGGSGLAAERQWETGTWVAPAIAAQVDSAYRNFAIETDRFRLDLLLNIERGGPPPVAKVNTTVTFAIEGDTVYVKQGDTEQALRLVKKTEKLRTYAAAGGGHYIEAVGDGGLTVTLEDGSVWEIDPMQQYRTRLWQPLVGITVTRINDDLLSVSLMKDVQPEFDYFLNNTEEDEGAGARLVKAP